MGSLELVLVRDLFGLLVVGFMYVVIIIIISLLYQQNAHIQQHTYIIINTLLHVSTLFAPPSGRTLSYAQCY